MASDRCRRRKCTSAGRITAHALLSFLAVTPVTAWSPVAQVPLHPNPHSASWHASDRTHGISEGPSDDVFTLRHVVHRGTQRYPSLHRRLDVDPARVRAAAQGLGDVSNAVGPFIARSSSVNMLRLEEQAVADLSPMLYSAQKYGATVTFPDETWAFDDVPSPNITDQETVINLSLMAGAAYNRDPSDSEWEDIHPPFNLSSDVGWEQDGLRGHVFANEDNSTIILAVKGTTTAVFDGAGTTTNDKENDNLFAGCCCGQGGNLMWRQVCDCMVSAYTCNETCIVKEMHKPSRYFFASMELYGNVTTLYPGAEVWLTGHSLGGLVTGLLGLVNFRPTVTFESVPAALAAGRLGLPTPPGFKDMAASRARGGLWNFGHTADPVYLGTCNSFSSSCNIGGYALQSQCHAGLRCAYDTVSEWQWRQSMMTHGIRGCIKDVYKAWKGVPTCEPDDECQDCFNWKRIKSNGSETTRTLAPTTSSTARTRTETCKTPGWWGCLDETTTVPRTTSTSIFTTETCISRGWFGNCVDSITTTVTSRTTMTLPATAIVTTTTSSTSFTSSTSTGCATPGWWGCRDSPTTSSTSTTLTSTSSECATPGRFWGCKDDTATVPPMHAITEAPWHDMIL